MIKYKKPKTVNHDLETFQEKLDKIEEAYQRGIITREEYADKVNALVADEMKIKWHSCHTTRIKGKKKIVKMNLLGEICEA